MSCLYTPVQELSQQWTNVHGWESQNAKLNTIDMTDTSRSANITIECLHDARISFQAGGRVLVTGAVGLVLTSHTDSYASL
jgi:hypothetical protein